ncbi:MAG TPA: signaling protein, partial [Verrucomicrobiales bacterium]|nr:signaling protein [Verrucomicrobiales bacterium]
MKPLLLSLATFTAANLNAQPAPPLLERLKDENARGTDLWIYNNLQGAMAEAKRTGKPIFV